MFRQLKLISSSAGVEQRDLLFEYANQLETALVIRAHTMAHRLAAGSDEVWILLGPKYDPQPKRG